MSEWLDTHRHWVPWIQAFAVLGFVGSLLALPWAVVRIPVDYFAGPRPPRTPFRRRHPVLRGLVWSLRNLLGVVLIAAGTAMLALPGQGLLTIAIGLVVADFPGKHRLEAWLVSRPGLLKSLNWIRARRGRPPLLPPPGEHRTDRRPDRRTGPPADPQPPA